MTTILKQLEEQLDALNSTMNDETDDSPEILAEQERLLNAIIAAEAADLTALSAKQLVSHFQRRARQAQGDASARFRLAAPVAQRPMRPTPRPSLSACGRSSTRSPACRPTPPPRNSNGVATRPPAAAHGQRRRSSPFVGAWRLRHERRRRQSGGIAPQV
jgi:hypothetical protein